MKLKAGNISMIYKNGALRYLYYGEGEVLRMIYFAVRDKYWETIPHIISNEKISQQENHFSISYDCVFHQGDILMEWKVYIEGNENSSLIFEIRGKALSTFQKNRAGFCVLHPIKESSGNNVTIFHNDGSKEDTCFPKYISPYQPFKNIKAMQWQLAPGSKATVQFEGDIFETEDHRNWTDNNFKTYCTPLSAPYPATMYAGDEVHQRVALSIEGSNEIKENEDNAIKISIRYNKKLSIPSIGIGRSSERSKTYLEELKNLTDYGFRHYRADIKLNEANWQIVLKEVIEESKVLNAPLEIALFINDGMDEKLDMFTDAIAADESIIKCVILLSIHTKCIATDSIKKILPILRRKLKYTRIGAGTDVYFTELNRSGLDATDVDFVNYSVNPQVHAFDDASLVENAQAQGFTIVSAKYKFNRPVHVSPVTLKMRRNADAAEYNHHLLPLTDSRQKTFFCAAWTLASLKQIIENNAAAVTYFETIGKRGLMEFGDNKSIQIYPVAEIFKWALQKKWTCFLESSSNKPFTVNSLVAKSNNDTCIVLVNHSNDIQIVSIECRNGFYHLQSLTSKDKIDPIVVENNMVRFTIKNKNIIILSTMDK